MIDDDTLAIAKLLEAAATNNPAASLMFRAAARLRTLLMALVIAERK